MEHTKVKQPQFVHVDELPGIIQLGQLVWYNYEDLAEEGEPPAAICQVIKMEPLVLRGYLNPMLKIVNPDISNFIAIATPVYVQHAQVSEEEFTGEEVEEDILEEGDEIMEEDEDVRVAKRAVGKRPDRKEKRDKLDDSLPIAQQMMK